MTNVDEELLNYLLNLKQKWRCQIPRLTNKELIVIFPEAKQIIPQKIKEWEIEKERKISTIKKKLGLIQNKLLNESKRWLYREWIKFNDVQDLLDIEKKIIRAKGMILTSQNKKPKGHYDEEEIQQASSILIENIVSQHTELRKSGNNLVGLCPFHNEKHPSFYVYPETNSCWCFGCNQGGNTINFIKLINGYSFKEAVEYLLRR